VIVQPPMAVMFAVAAVLFYVLATLDPISQRRRRLWAAGGLICVTAMVLASWDPLFMPLGLLLAALYSRERVRVKLAAAYCAAAALTFAAIQAVYVLSYPAFFADQVATIGYRMGLPFKAPSALRLHGIVDQVGYSAQISAVTCFVNQFSNLLRNFSPFVLLAGCLFLGFWWQPALRRNHKALLIVGGLCFPWVLWAIVMRQYMAIHDFTLVLAAPFLALATAFILNEALEWLNRRGPRGALWVLAIVLPLLVFHSAFQAAVHAKARFTKPEFGDLSMLIQSNTPPNAIVLSPEQFSVPVYYSKRHIVRGIDSLPILKQATAQAHAAFPGSPLYLAIRTDGQSTLDPTAAGLVAVTTLGDARLYQLP
jgi:hypothetical protein